MSFSKPAPYKKYQCRYFDETGYPLTPCKQGDQCRFVHPEDPQWPGVKCYPYFHKNTSSYSSRARHDYDSDRRHRSPSGGRGVPLAPQGALYRRFKVEEEDIPLNYDSNWKPDSTSRRRPASQEPSGDRRRTAEPSEKRKATDQTESNAETTNKNIINASNASASNSTGPNPHVDSDAEAKERAERFVSMFKDVAMVSSQIIQDTVLLDQEERKLQTFNEISTTLAKISASSAASVAGPIADILLAHAQSKERLDENFRLLGAAWEKVFNSFMVEFSTGLENKLQAALASVKNEARLALNSNHSESQSLKRRSDRISTSPEPERQGDRRSINRRQNRDQNSSPARGRSSTRDYKRRRLASSSRSYSRESRQNKGETAARPSMAQVSLDDILNQMKMKIDQQTDSLQKLSKENEELKSRFQSPPQGPRSQRVEPTSRPSTSTRSEKNSFSHASGSERRPFGFRYKSRNGFDP
ncbi:hypothetical protein EV361DRAFT_532163 [Lentinula raphanica]|nr:hypothetical protein EV361DRAFT_532163 [Lentinula raphanica]